MDKELFDVVVSDVDEGNRSSLSQAADVTRSGGSAYLLESRKGLQRDLDNLHQ